MGKKILIYIIKSSAAATFILYGLSIWTLGVQKDGLGFKV